MEFSDQLYIIFRVIIGTILAGFVGFEREARNKPAGLRTHMIVGGGSALLLCLSLETVNFYLKEGGADIETDPIRIIQAIIIGLGFMGGGTILKDPGTKSIKYLTTAAGFLISAGIGMAAAIELYIVASGVAVFFILVNQLGALFKKIYFRTSEDEKNNDED